MITDIQFKKSNDSLVDYVSKAKFDKTHFFVILSYHMDKKLWSRIGFNRFFMPVLKEKCVIDERFIILFKGLTDILIKTPENGVAKYKCCVMGYNFSVWFFDANYQKCSKLGITFIKVHPELPYGDPCPILEHNQTLDCHTGMCPSTPKRTTSSTVPTTLQVDKEFVYVIKPTTPDALCLLEILQIINRDYVFFKIRLYYKCSVDQCFPL